MKHPRPGQPDQFTTDRVDPVLAATLEKSKLTFSGQPAAGVFATLLGWLLPVLTFATIFYFFSGGRLGGTGGLLSISKSRARVYAEDDVPRSAFVMSPALTRPRPSLRRLWSF